MNSGNKRQKRFLRHKRVRAVVKGTSQRPRLSVFRANKHIYAQIIDDAAGRTLAQASTLETKPHKAVQNKTELASAVGKAIAKKAKEKNISEVVFDRGGYKYHGRVKALADAARSEGLKF